MMGKRRTQTTRANVRAVRQHLCFMGIKPATLAKYKTAVRRFTTYLHFVERPFPLTPHDFDDVAAEFVNYLYQDDRPLDWAASFMSGIKRFVPNVRRHMETAALYIRNWGSSIDRVRAFPYTVDMVQCMATLLALEKKYHMAILVLMAFSGLFRLGELFKLQVKQVEIISETFCIVSLIGTKARRGAVTVVLSDRTVITLLKRLLVQRSPTELLFDCRYQELQNVLRFFARMIDVPGDRFTGHGFRRGGATFHYKKWASYDRVQALGRWAEAKTCRLYIDEAVADRLTYGLSKEGSDIIKDGVDGFAPAMAAIVRAA